MPHRQNFELSGIPLLPYERQLIQFLQISEAEYRQYRDDLINSGKPRPAEYDLIPDIRNEPTTIILINLAIGLALTAVSAMLMPKPRAPKQREDNTESIKLSDQRGRSRFNSVAGFDGLQEIAELGAAIPINFGKYEEHTRDGQKYHTGGFMASPQLVWSRMFSYGSHQGFKGIYAIGECLNDPDVDIKGKDDPTRPDDAGIQIGTLPLDAVPEQQHAVYWNTNFIDGRIKAHDLIYGTRGNDASGDPEKNDDIFLCPTEAGSNNAGFCMAYTPSGDTTFGFHSPIANGQAFMLNFKIIPFPAKPKPNDPDEFTNAGSDPNDRILLERRKIAGSVNDQRDDGMDGIGRGYSSKMGIYSLNGRTVSRRENRVSVKVGDEIKFVIKQECFTTQNTNTETGSSDNTVKVNDVNNAVNSRRAAADDALQIGEVFMIGRTIWQVTNRTDKTWRADKVNDEGNSSEGGGQYVDITLKMIESTTIDDMNRIGLPGTDSIDRFVTWEGGDIETYFNGPSYWSLGRISFAVIRNVRPAEVTEFGIRSQVWNQANGLCNFSNLPSPQTLSDYEWEGNQLTSGSMSLYYKRTSVFTIWIRPVSETRDNLPWQPLGEQFCVTGQQPVDQYNFISLTDKNPTRRQMEFRFIPKCSAEIAQLVPPGEEFIRLDAKLGRSSISCETKYGLFKVEFAGERITWDAAGDLGIEFNKEYYSGGQLGSSRQETEPTEVTEDGRIGGSYGITSAYSAFILNDRNPDDYPGQIFTGTRTVDLGSKFITLKFTYYSQYLGPNSDYYFNFNRIYYWNIRKIEVERYGGDWEKGERFEDIINDTNYYSEEAGLNDYGLEFYVSDEKTTTITTPKSNPREFGGRTQINEYSMYDEVNSSAANGPEHTVVYVNETVTPNVTPQYPLSTMGLAVRSSNQISSIEQVRVWMADGVSVKRWKDNTYGPSNLFSDLVYYLLTDKIAGLGSWNSKQVWTNTSTFKDTSSYLDANNIRFDGTIESKVNLRKYLTDAAPLNLCNFVIANGQFSIIPALPYDAKTYKIKSDALTIKQVFSAGNIVDGSYRLEYLDREEREDFKAVMVYRKGFKNKTPQNDTVLVRWNRTSSERAPQTVFDISNFCTDIEQAKMVGRYLLSTKRRIDHAISFQTSPLGLSLAPGDYIKVLTTDSPDSTYTIGAISPDNGRILSATEVADGTHEVTAYVPGADAVRLITIEVVNNCVTDPALFGTLFTTLVPREKQNTYLVEQLELDEEGLVNVTATHFPTGIEKYQSIIAQDVLDEPLPGQTGDSAKRFIYAI